MEQEFKTKWIAALRSGEYKQCEGALHKGGGYCCLGVALKVDERFSLRNYRRNADGGSQQIPSVKVIRTWDLPDDLMYDLIAMNDDGYDFPDIANYIEERA